MAEIIRVLRIKPMEAPQFIEIENTLEALHKQVGGYIQAVYPWEDPVAIIADEEGKLKGYRANRVLEDENGEPYDIIAGTFLIVGLTEDDFTSLPDVYAKKYEEKFRWGEIFMRASNGKILWMRLKPGEEIPRLLF